MKFSSAVACYLPGFDPASLAWHTLTFGDAKQQLQVQVPLLSPEQLKELTIRVSQASRNYLKNQSISHIIGIIDRAIARLLDPQDPYRREADRLLPLVTGFDPEMIRLTLTAYLKCFRAPQLERFVAEDFANPKVLDVFQPRPKGGWAQALGPDILAHVWAGNVPGLPLWSLISGLLVKAGNIGKVSSAEPLLASWFARLLSAVEPRMTDCLAIVWWPSGEPLLAQYLFSQADIVVAYGGNAALHDIRQQVPAHTRFLPHGHKLSFGMVSACVLDARQAISTARMAALDVVRYEQQGCYSPHLFYVARGGKVSPQEFANYLAAELAALQHKFARRALSLEESVSLANWHQTWELEAMADNSTVLLGEVSSAWHVAFSNIGKPLMPSVLNRTVSVVAVDHLDDVIALIASQRAWLQTVGLATSPEELFALAARLGLAGVTRICAIGSMTSPEPGWHHDGRFSLLDLVQIVEIEQSAELAAEAFSSYRN